MPNAVEMVKQAAVEAVEAGKPVNLLFGQVISVSPLKVQADQKAIYTEKMLILTRNVTDFELDMTVSHQTELIKHTHSVTGEAESSAHGHSVSGTAGDDAVTGEAAPSSHGHSVAGTAEETEHKHPIKGRKKYKVHNALMIGDWVLLGRMQGGKRFVILDRIKPIPKLEGEWL